MLSSLLPLIITAGAAVLLLSALAAVLWLMRRGIGGAPISLPRARYSWRLLPRLLTTFGLLGIGLLFSRFVSGLLFPLLLILFFFRWKRPRKTRTRRFRRYNGYEPFWRYPGPADREEGGPPIDTDFRHMN